MENKFMRVEEVAAARTYDDVQTCCSEHAACGLYLTIRWGSASFGYAGAQLYTVGTAFLCGDTALYAVGANLKFIIVSHIF